jgi:hypothetical protein
MERINLLKLAKQLISLQNDLDTSILQYGELDQDKAKMLADCRDYCVCLISDSLKEEATITDVMQELTSCEAYAESVGDSFHTGFFFALSQMLSIMRTVNTINDEASDRSEFEESWSQTCEKLGL